MGGRGDAGHDDLTEVENVKRADSLNLSLRFSLGGAGLIALAASLVHTELVGTASAQVLIHVLASAFALACADRASASAGLGPSGAMMRRRSGWRARR